MTWMKLVMARVLSFAIARSPPGASLSWPVSVWQLAQVAAKTVLPRRTSVVFACLCPPQPQARSVRADAAASRHRRSTHVVRMAERVAARLRPDAEPVRACTDGDAREQPAGAG